MGRIRCEVCGLKKRQVGLGDLNKWECIDCWCERNNYDLSKIYQNEEKDIDSPFADWNLNRAMDKINRG